MRTDLFDFELPPDCIAIRPVVPRDAARMLVVRPGGGLEDNRVRGLPLASEEIYDAIIQLGSQK